VIVTEVDAFAALQATMDGHRVLKMEDAVPLGDLFIITTAAALAALVGLEQQALVQLLGSGGNIAVAGRRDSSGGLALRGQALAKIGATNLAWSSFWSRDFAARPQGLSAVALALRQELQDSFSAL
jgi:hypothetical protein